MAERLYPEITSYSRVPEDQSFFPLTRSARVHLNPERLNIRRSTLDRLARRSVVRQIRGRNSVADKTPVILLLLCYINVEKFGLLESRIERNDKKNPDTVYPEV